MIHNIITIVCLSTKSVGFELVWDTFSINKKINTYSNNNQTNNIIAYHIIQI